MGCKKVIWSKKEKTVRDKLPTKGAVRIRPVSFGMDKIIDKYVVTGAGFDPVITQGKKYALTVAKARVRVSQQHAKRKRQKKRVKR